MTGSGAPQRPRVLLVLNANAGSAPAELQVEIVNVDGELVDLKTPLHFSIGPKLTLRVSKTR